MKTEIVTLSIDVELKFESAECRDDLFNDLKREVTIDVRGAGRNGCYSMKTVKGTARVTVKKDL